MTRINDILKENEKIVYRTGIHWVILGGPAMLLFLSGISIPSQGMSAIALFAVAVAWAILSYIILQNTDFTVTNNRLLMWTLFPWKKLREIKLTEIVNADFYQPTLGKLLNFGKVTIAHSNIRTVSYRMVNSPYGFIISLQQQVEAGNVVQRR